MTKRGSMAATAISVLIFVGPACQSQGNRDMPRLKGDPAVAQSTVNPELPQSKDKSAMDKSAMASSKGQPEHTQRDLDCAKARADQRCVGAANQCFYKFTVNEVVDQQNLKVTYPPSVWKETPESMRNTPEETAYRTKLEKIQFNVPLRAMNAAEAGKTYVFTRCPENEFTLGSEIDPSQIGMPSAPNQSKR